ncbi:cytochrome P450 [Streptomyces rimosus]|uniref:cytochrome P450 n=1 Tax=Streptomyces rimosus TaxID=1927 RepID=UPI00067AA8FB|nr:cytochrome P450 [Streptomyces rimosus]
MQPETAPAPRRLSDLPCPPGRLPLLGHALPLVNRPFAFLEAVRELGDIVRIQLGGTPMYMLNEPEHVHTILVTEARKVARGILFERGRKLVGNGLLGSEGAFHLRQRRLMQPALQRTSTAAHATLMRRNTLRLGDSWQHGQVVDVQQAMTDLVIRNTTDALFGLSADEATTRAMCRAAPVLLDNLVRQYQSPAFLERFPLPFNRRVAATSRAIHRTIAGVIVRRIADPGKEDLISTLLSARDPATGEPMPPRQVHDEAFSIFVAGVGTTAATLSWFFHELARHPEVEERVVAETSALAGDDLPAADPPDRLGHTRRAVQEVLRMHGVLLVMRRTTAPVRLGTVEMPAGTEIGYSPHGIQRDPARYPDPLRLDPDRWLLPRTPPLPKGAFIPFGEGRHRCIGEHFARAQLLTAAVLLLPRWRLRPAPGATVREMNGIHPRPSSLHMTVTSR